MSRDDAMLTNSVFKLFVLASAAAILALVLRKQSPELALLVSAAGCAAAMVWILQWFTPVLELGRSLCEKAGLDRRLADPLWKTAGIGLMTQAVAAVCADAGQSALAKLVELGGGILCLVLSLPLLEAVLDLIGALL